MKRLFLICTLISNITYAQNLVPNGDFENYTVCPFTSGDIEKAFPWFQPYIGVGSSSTDYFNSCNNSINGAFGVPANFVGYNYAKSGAGYAGIVTYSGGSNWREYLEIELTDTLAFGIQYCVSFYVNRAEDFNYTADKIGAYLSIDSLTYFNPPFGVLALIPQMENSNGNFLTDTVNWTLIQGNFISTGGEKFLTIGNFNDDQQTNVVTIQSTGQIAAYYYIDDVSVVQGLCTVGLEEAEVKSGIKIYPNPSKDVCLITAKQFTNAVLSVYDITGRVIFTQEFSQQFKLNAAMFTPGVYIVEIKNKQGSGIKTKLIKE